MIPRLLFLAVLALALPAQAQITAAGPMATQMGTSYVVSYATNGTPIAAAARSITATGGEALIRDMFNVSGPAGSLPVAVSRTATAASVALGLARVAAKVATPLAVGMAAYDLLAGAGVRQGASGAELDSGASPVPITCTGYSNFGGAQRVDCLTAKEACDLRASQTLAPFSGSKRGRLAGSGSSLTCVQELSSDGVNWNAWNADLFGNPSTITNAKSCTPIVDALTGQSYVPGIRDDGKCITGRYEPATESQVQAAVQPRVESSLLDSMKAAISAGASIPSSPPSVSGPASQVGQPRTTTTTGPAGQTATTATPTYQYNYAGDTITYNTTNQTVTNITSPTGQTTTETKTETQPEPADTKQLCDTYPESLACMKPGTAPDADAMPTKSQPVTFTPDPRWGASAGACSRGPVVLSFGTFDLWKPFCDWAQLIRGVIVAGFSLAAAGVFLAGVRQG